MNLNVVYAAVLATFASLALGESNGCLEHVGIQEQLLDLKY